MKYRVFWTPEAERELRRIVAASDDRTIVSAAAREIDRLLVADPHDVGESRVETTRKGFVRPLGVDFEVLDDVATVIVFGVWRTDRRR
jgi:hypothetical protein